MIFKLFSGAAGLVLCIGLTACRSGAPDLLHPFIRVDPGATLLVEQRAFHVDPRPSDRYAVAGPDLRWDDSLGIGPADNPSGRCSVRPGGDVEVVAPQTSGHWPCLIRVCRDGCLVARLTIVAEPKGDELSE